MRSALLFSALLRAFANCPNCAHNISQYSITEVRTCSHTHTHTLSHTNTYPDTHQIDRQTQRDTEREGEKKRKRETERERGERDTERQPFRHNTLPHRHKPTHIPTVVQDNVDWYAPNRLSNLGI
jgi:hypothetical protein